jgi:hypothetical protein
VGPYVAVRIYEGASAIVDAFAFHVARFSPENVDKAVACALEWPEICEGRHVPEDVAQRAITETLAAIRRRIATIELGSVDYDF